MTDTMAEKRRGWAVVLGLVVVEAVVLGAWAARTHVNADEGFYLAGARHVSEGRHLYRDIFFPQMPYLPWVQAALISLFGSSLGFGRGLSAAGGAISAGIVARIAWRQEQSVRAAAVIGALYVLSGLLMSTLSINKTYGLTNLCLLAAFAALASESSLSMGKAFGAGVAMGCAVGLRLVVAPVAVIFAVMAWRSNRAALAAFVLGGVIASLPWIWAASRAPDQFWFCTFAFHRMRREITGLSAILTQKVGVMARWGLLPQHVVLWFLAGIGCWRAPRRVWPAAACVVVLAAAYAAATPTYLEYLAQFFPFALLAAAPAATWLWQRPGLATVILGVYVLGLYPILRSNAGGTKEKLWRLRSVHEVADYVRAHTAVDEPVLSWWEGYPVLSGRPGYVGVGFWESNVAKKLDSIRARRYHVMRREEIRDTIRRREPAAVVVADGVWEEMQPDLESGYDPARRFAAVTVYTRRQ